MSSIYKSCYCDLCEHVTCFIEVEATLINPLIGEFYINDSNRVWKSSINMSYKYEVIIGTECPILYDKIKKNYLKQQSIIERLISIK